MPGFEFKRINEGSDAGKFLFYIEGILVDGCYTMDEIRDKIAAMEDMPEALDNPRIMPCNRDCPKRSATCHGNCPAYFVYSHTRRLESQAKAKQYESFQFVLDTTNRIRKRTHKK